jgi:hypothetical protein
MGPLVSTDPQWKKPKGDTRTYVYIVHPTMEDGWHLEDDGPTREEELASFASSIRDRRRQAEFAPTVDAARRFSREATRGLNPREIAGGMREMVTHPLQTLGGLAAGHDELRQSGVESWEAGRYGDAARQFAYWGLPVAAAGATAALAAPAVTTLGALGTLGAMGTSALIGSFAGQGAERAHEFIGEGDYPEAAGAAVNTAVHAALPQIVERGGRAAAAGARSIVNQRVGGPNVGRLRGRVDIDPVVRQRANYAREHGIDVDVASGTGSVPIRGIQEITDRSPLRLFNRDRARQRGQIESDMVRISESIAPTRAGVPPGDVYRTSLNIIESLEQRAAALNARARAAYRPVEQASEAGATVANPRRAYQSLYDKLKKEYTVDGKLQPVDVNTPKGKSFSLLDDLMKEGDHISLIRANDLLSELQNTARVKDLWRQTRDQGIARMAGVHWRQAIDASAKRAGVLDDLRAGRAATVDKYRVMKIIDELPSKRDPASLAASLQSPRSRGYARTRALEREVPPQAMADMGRAIFDDIVAPIVSPDATAASAATALRKWHAWGDRNKAIYMKPQHISDIDNILGFSAEASKSANPTGSALVGAQVVMGGAAYWAPGWFLFSTLGQYAIAKLLHNPATARILSEGATLGRSFRDLGNQAAPKWMITAKNKLASDLRAAAPAAGVTLEMGRAGIRASAEAGRTPDMAGTPSGVGKQFTRGPFAGQTWTVVDGAPQRVN